MKRLSMIMVCVLAMMAACLSAKAQEVTITLYPGNTWISYPRSEMLDINTALGDFVPAEGDIIKSQFTSSTYRNGYWRGGVTHFMPGWGYKYYSNRTEVVSFVFGTPAPQLIVNTAEPTEITAISAISGGSLTSSDGSYIVVLEKGICWATHPNPTVMNDFHTENGNGINSFTSEMTDLNFNTIYYVRAYAVTDSGTTYGEEMSFTTRDGIPTLTTDSITSITGASATSGGNITNNGGLSIAARGVCWSTIPNPTIDDSHTVDSYGTGYFSSSITDLSVSTTYYVRAYATTVAGTAYGEQKTFTTRNGIPTLTTGVVTNIGSCWGNSGGNILDDGGLPITARGVCWSTFPNPTLADSHTINGNGIGNFSSSIIGLSDSTVYYVRAYATNGFTTAYGNEDSFITTIAHPGVINAIFSVSDTQYVLFSQGNLQYQATTNTWRFADSQFGYIGDANNNISSTYSGWIDLFCWGTSGWNSGNTYYHPWDFNNSDGDAALYGPSGQYDLIGLYANSDWGVYNPISNGGNTANQWRTLTKTEWDYVLNTRSTTSGIRYAMAKVNNVNGVILLPDNWNASTYSLNNTNGGNFSSNTISAFQWTTLENAGAVFLPAAGNRYGTSVNSVGFGGTYYSASNAGFNNAWCIGFSSSKPSVGVAGRFFGRSVRLVRVAEN